MSVISPKQMSYCGACLAPNPAGRADCWSCAEPLAPAIDPTPAVPPPPAPMFRTCAQCARQAPAYHTHCPLCGRAFGAPDAGPLTAAPSGWKLERRANGSLRLQRRRVPLWLTALCAGPVGWRIVLDWAFRFQPHPVPVGLPFENDWNRWNTFDTVAVIIDLVLIAALFVVPRLLFPPEEWIVEPGAITIWRHGFRRVVDRQISGAAFILSRDWVPKMGSHDLEQQTRLRLAVGSWSMPVAGDSGRVRNTAAFAQLLSSVTGWPVEESGTR